MRKMLLVVITLVLVASGYWLGQWRQPEPAVIHTPLPSGSYVSSEDSSQSGRQLETPNSGELLLVRDGDSIQEAVNRAGNGAVIRVFPGTYRETVFIDKDNITLSGVIQRGGYPVLDGGGALNDAILYSGNGVTIENLKITRYKGNGIMGQAGDNYVIRNNLIIDTGVYGIFPQLGRNGIVSHNMVSGIEDAGIYVGMSDHVDVVYNHVFESVAGIEIENSRHALVEGNSVYNNTGGILAFITPGLPLKTCGDVVIRNNFVIDNNHENFAIPGSLVANIPPGTGVLIMACDDVVLEGNIISGNDSMGIAFTDFSLVDNVAVDPESDPLPNRPVILENLLENNGNNPAPMVRAILAAMLESRGPDIIDTVGMEDGCQLFPGRHRTIGLENYGECAFSTTSQLRTHTLPERVPPRDLSGQNAGKLVYYGVCAGCHAWNSRLIGPPVQVVQALYQDDAGELAAYIADPVRKRPDYPEMPPQAHLNEATRLAVADFMLSLEN